MSHYLFLFVTMTFAYTAISQDVVSPKVEETPHLSGSDPVIAEGIPVDISEPCPENMILYSGPDDQSPATCECRPGFLYFPLNNTCFEGYRQGPCQQGSYVHLPEGEDVPVCTENPCLEDGQVPFNGKCYTIESTEEEPCGIETSIRVNTTTFQLECIKLPMFSIMELVTVPKISKNPCPPNGRKIKGVCSTLSSTENTNTENLLDSMKNTSMPHTESTSNSTENITTMNITQSNCPKNMIPVIKNPEDNSWTCLCLWPFVYLNVYNTCSEFFRQGPCEFGNFVVQPPYNASNPESPGCAPNLCLEDGLVLYNGTCRNITTDPICNYGHRYFIETTLEIGCDTTTFSYMSVIAAPRLQICPPNSRPDKYGKCRRIL